VNGGIRCAFSASTPASPGAASASSTSVPIDRHRSCTWASSAHAPISRSANAAVIAAGLRDVLSEHRPDVVAVERVFAQQNRATVMGTAQASGVALLLAAEHGLPAATHTPSR
jgi:crossover junction endodeoxyribonuclease RuvC